MVQSLLLDPTSTVARIPPCTATNDAARNAHRASYMITLTSTIFAGTSLALHHTVNPNYHSPPTKTTAITAANATIAP